MKLRIGRREVNISNPDKSLPERGLKMLDLVNHYLDVADCVLNHVQRRPMRMKRFPDGPRSGSSTRSAFRRTTRRR